MRGLKSSPEHRTYLFVHRYHICHLRHYYYLKDKLIAFWIADVAYSLTADSSAKLDYLTHVRS